MSESPTPVSIAPEAAKTPSFSVIVPIYNVAPYLKRCLDSLLAQSVAAAEVLLIDDGSTDESAEIAQSYAARHSNFRYYRFENGGLGVARNRAVQLAQSDYLLFVDSDDYVSSDLVARCLEVAQKQAVDLIAFDYNQIREDGSLVYVSNHPKLKDNCHLEGSLVQTLLSPPGYQVWPYAYRREFVIKQELRCGEGYLVEDPEFTVQAVLSARSAAYIHEPFYFYVFNANSILNNNSLERFALLAKGVLKSAERLLQIMAEYEIQAEQHVHLINHIFWDLCLTFCDPRMRSERIPVFLEKARAILDAFADSSDLQGLEPPLAEYCELVRKNSHQADEVDLAQLLGSAFAFAQTIVRHEREVNRRKEEYTDLQRERLAELEQELASAREKIAHSEERIAQLEAEIPAREAAVREEYESSRSYRIGRTITWPLRKLRG